MDTCSPKLLLRAFLLLALALLSACVPYRVGTPAVAGRVVNAASAIPVVGASVTISGGGAAAQTQTNSAGDFSLLATSGRWHLAPLISEGIDYTPIGTLRVEANDYRLFVRDDVGLPVLVPARPDARQRQEGADQVLVAKPRPGEEDLQKLRVALQPKT